MTSVKHSGVDGTPFKVAVCLVICLVVALLSSPAANAQLTDEQLQTLIDSAKDSGATVVVISPDEEDAAVAPANRITGFAVRNRLESILARAPELPSRIVGRINELGQEQGSSWLLMTVAAGVLFIGIALYAQIRYARWARVHFMDLFDPHVKTRSEKIGFLLARTALRFLGIALLFIIAYVLILAFSRFFHPAAYATQHTMLVYYVGVRVILTSLDAILAVDTPTHRVLALSDESAETLYKNIRFVIVISATAFGACMWMSRLGLDHDAHQLMLVASVFFAGVALATFSIRNRHEVANAIRGGEQGAERTFFGVIISKWHVLFSLYVVAASAVSAVRIIMDRPGAFGLVALPLIVLIGALGVYGLGIVILDRWFANRAVIIPPVEAEDGNEPSEAIVSEPDVVAVVTQRTALHVLCEQGLAIAIAAGGIFIIAQRWGVGDTDVGGVVTRFIDIGLIVFLAFMIWRAVEVSIALRLKEEVGDVSSEDHSDEGFGKGASRIATLLPLMRSVLLITVLVMTVMIALSQMGVDIGPLLAGAGVVGIAVGFGAQALVRDIISGAFFLMDDAFRSGEYIDIGTVKGTVEKISIRSMQLRHHNGPLNTVPFGEIQQLTNFSRDWVVMKLPLRITYDTDVEMVRKLIKKLGQELLRDPDLGPQFLEPLKSQGVNMIEDSAIIIRVKFKTRPGRQFELRKVVYQRIQDLFQKNNIRFASREVTVRVADAERPLSAEEKTAVAGAARPLLDDNKPATSTADAL